MNRNKFLLLKRPNWIIESTSKPKITKLIRKYVTSWKKRSRKASEMIDKVTIDHLIWLYLHIPSTCASSRQSLHPILGKIVEKSLHQGLPRGMTTQSLNLRWVILQRWWHWISAAGSNWTKIRWHSLFRWPRCLIILCNFPVPSEFPLAFPEQPSEPQSHPAGQLPWGSIWTFSVYDTALIFLSLPENK